MPAYLIAGGSPASEAYQKSTVNDEIVSPYCWIPTIATAITAAQAIRRRLGRSAVEGESVSIVYRWADGDNRRLPELAADLIRIAEGLAR